MNRYRYEQCLKVLRNAVNEDRETMSIVVKLKDNEYNVEDVSYEQFVAENDRIYTLITIKIND